jgi:vacuolar-type H+-ATPase subunit I/STV1
MTQVQLGVLQEQFSNLQDLIDDGNKKKKAAEPISMTQAGIVDLTEKIDELEGLVRRRTDTPRKPPPMSANQIAIQELQKKVKKLTDELEYKNLYCDSLEHDFFAREARTRNTEYSELLERKNELEEENRELLEYINRDKKRLKKRRHWKY